MFSRADATISRDRNLNFDLSDANSMQILDNQKKKETSENVSARAAKFSSRRSPLQDKKKETRTKEYDNYISTFSGSNKNTRLQTFPPPKMSGSSQGENSVTAISKSMRQSTSLESPGTRKLIRTPTQEMSRVNIPRISILKINL